MQTDLFQFTALSIIAPSALRVHAWALPPTSRFQGILEEGVCPQHLARADWHPGPLWSVSLWLAHNFSCQSPCSAPGSPLHSHLENQSSFPEAPASDPKVAWDPASAGKLWWCPPSPPARPEDRPQPYIEATTPLRQPLGLKASHSNKTGKPLLAMKSLRIPFKSHYYHHYWSDEFSCWHLQQRSSSEQAVFRTSPPALPLDDSPKHQLQLSLILGPVWGPLQSLFPPQAACSARRESSPSQSPVHPAHSLHWTHEEKRPLKTSGLLRSGKKLLLSWDTHRLSVLPSSSLKAKPGLTGPTTSLLMNSCVWNPCYNIHHFTVFYQILQVLLYLHTYSDRGELFHSVRNCILQMRILKLREPLLSTGGLRIGGQYSGVQSSSLGLLLS